MARNNPTVDELTADMSMLNITPNVQRPQYVIGFGTSSTVSRSSYAWVDTNSRQMVHMSVAVKQIGNGRMGQQEVEQRVKREVAVWRSLHHPNITQFLGIVYLQPGMPPCMVSSLLQNNLLAYIESHPGSGLGKAREIAAGVEYLHSQKVVHGDIKAGNILVSDDGVAKINDFDMARILDVEGFSAEIRRDARYNAPELLTPGQSNSIPPTLKTDIFSLGILFLQIFHGRGETPENELPYNHIRRDGYDSEFMNLVRNGERPVRERYRAMSDRHWELLCHCWKGNPAERPNITWVVRAL